MVQPFQHGMDCGTSSKIYCGLLWNHSHFAEVVFLWNIFNRVYDRVEGWRAGKACLMASRGRTEDYE